MTIASAKRKLLRRVSAADSGISRHESAAITASKGCLPVRVGEDWQCFRERHLPSQDDFRSTLRGNESISHADYMHAQRVWLEFQMKTFGEYHDLYLRSDVVLLADVFESFRKMCMEEQGIDPAHCLSAPNLSWHCMLKYTGVSLQLLTDRDMYEMIQGGLRGGMCLFRSVT